MLKLLTAYRANPTLKNAQKVRAYERSHQMATSLMTREDADMVADAIYHANQGYVRPLD